MRIPNIVFSNWTRWDNRTSLQEIDKPGVYLLACFKESPPENIDPQGQEIIYIGETCNRTLRKRWVNFHRAAFEGKKGHSGGESYREIYRDYGHQLFVAAFPTGEELSDKLRSLFIRYVERKLILEYALKWGTAPRCNKK